MAACEANAANASEQRERDPLSPEAACPGGQLPTGSPMLLAEGSIEARSVGDKGGRILRASLRG